MSQEQKFNHVHFIGIGGIGMSAVAEVMIERGYTISGSDLNESDQVQMLRGRGATIYVPQRAENITDDIDGVLVMTVDPGFAGQKLIPSALEKIKKLREYLDERGCDNIEIEVDGNVSFHNAALMNEMGANIFVSGTSGVFSKDGTIKENIAKLRGIIS